GPRQDRGRTARSFLASNLYGLPEAVRITLKVDASPPRRDRAAKAGAALAEERPDELTFRTTVRLFLAGRRDSAGSGGAADGAGAGGAPGAEGGPAAGKGG